ncbi:hypothetical protein WME94_02770 [Sorangium sp. So ce429]
MAGSKRAHCLAALWRKDPKGKPLAVPPELQAKAQAFFDSL